MKDELKQHRRVFSGTNLARLEANVEEFIKSIGGEEYVINQRLNSTNPEYQIVVEYYIKSQA